MRTEKIAALAITAAISICFVSEARAKNPLITLQDMDPIVAGLPQKDTPDRVNQLKNRLSELDTEPADLPERKALHQALSLIRILRQTRISARSSRALKTGVGVDHAHRVVFLVNPVNGRDRPGVKALRVR